MSFDVAARFETLAAPWMTGDFGGLDGVMAADVRYHVPPFADVDLAGYRDFVSAFRLAFPDFMVTADETIVEGDHSCHRWHCEATFTGESPMVPVAPTGRRTAATGTHVCHWRDGMLVEAWHHGDWLSWLQGAGVIPPLG